MVYLARARHPRICVEQRWGPPSWALNSRRGQGAAGPSCPTSWANTSRGPPSIPAEQVAVQRIRARWHHDQHDRRPRLTIATPRNEGLLRDTRPVAGCGPPESLVEQTRFRRFPFDGWGRLKRWAGHHRVPVLAASRVRSNWPVHRRRRRVSSKRVVTAPHPVTRRTKHGKIVSRLGLQSHWGG